MLVRDRLCKSSCKHSCKCVCVKLLSHVQLFATLWTVEYKAPLSMGFSRQEYWSGLQFPIPGDLPGAEIELASPAFQADSLPLSHPDEV